jgi:hypothetical protein
LDIGCGQLQVDRAFVVTVNRRAECVRRSETICRTAGVEIDSYRGAARRLVFALT